MPDGSIIQTGGKPLDNPGYDLTGLFVGSEGTFGIVTKLTVRIMRLPESVKTLLAVFETIDDAAKTAKGVRQAIRRACESLAGGGVSSRTRG